MQTNNITNKDRSDENLVLRINQTNRTEYTCDRDQLNQNTQNVLSSNANAPPQPIINNPINQQNLLNSNNPNPVGNQFSPQMVQPPNQNNNIIYTMIFDPNQLKNSSTNVVCPYCKNQVMTNAIRRCDCCNLLCCLFTLSCCTVPYCCFQCCRGKNISCYSASHYCPMCGGYLKEYLAC